MIVARTIAEARAALRSLPRPLGFVPTMGALHAGHLSLVDAARSDAARRVAASVFVNPTQFGRGEDFDSVPARRGPRPAPARGGAASRSSSRRTPTRCTRTASPPACTSAARSPRASRAPRGPSHFDGVAVIVTKLLGVVQPDVLFLGEKDAQQLAVVRRFVRDLDLPVEVAGVPTLREPDGLAMSSRNVYLTPEQRAVAPDLYRALLAGAAAAGEPGAAGQGRRRRGDERPAAPATAPLDARRDRRGPRRARASSSTTSPSWTPTRSSPRAPSGRARCLVVAARLGATRLIDTISAHAQRVPRQGRDRMKGRTTMATVFVNGKQQDHVREGLVRVITGSIEFASNGDADMIKITDEVKPRPCARPASATAPSPCSCPAPPAP